MTDSQSDEDEPDYELAIIFFEHVQAKMNLALAVGDAELIDEIQSELAAAAAAFRAAKAPQHVVN